MKLFTTSSVDYLEEEGHDFWKETFAVEFWKCISLLLSNDLDGLTALQVRGKI